MKRGMRLLTGLLMAVSVGVFATHALPMPLSELIKAAQREGEVSHTDTVPSEAWTELVKRFNSRFGTTLKINQVNILAAAGITRLREEKAAGRITIDIYRSSGSFTSMLLKADLLAEPFDWVGTFGGTLPGIGKVVGPPRVPSKNLQNRIVLFDDLTKGIAYNTKLVAQKDVPKKWEDLLDPKWRNKKIAVDPRGAGTYQLLLFQNREWVLDFNRKLKEQIPIYFTGAMDTAAAVDRGEALLSAGTGIKDILAYDNVGMAPEIPLVAAPRNMAIVKGAPHPNAARLWAAWYALEGIPLLNREFKIYYGLIDGDCEQARFAKRLGLKWVFEGQSDAELAALAEMQSAIQKIFAR